jgi:hypothetical protein
MKELIKSFGRLANSELCGWRMQAHFWFDPLAKGKLIDRFWKEFIPSISTMKKHIYG